MTKIASQSFDDENAEHPQRLSRKYNEQKNNKKPYKLIKVFSPDSLNAMHHLCDISMCYTQVTQGSDMFSSASLSVASEGSPAVPPPRAIVCDL